MTNESGLPQIEIVVLDYYDGATEGFTLSVAHLGLIYFKLIAWDENQDQRLFAAIPVSKLVIDAFCRLLLKTNEVPYVI